MKKIEFSQKSHTYNKGDVIYTSVTKLISKYKIKFNPKFWSAYKAYEELMPDTFSEVKSCFSPPYDHNLIAACAHAYTKELGGEMSDVLEKMNEITGKWKGINKKAIKKGNKYHDSQEALSYSKKTQINPFTNKEVKVIQKSVEVTSQNQSLVNNLYELKDGYYPELLIWNDPYKLAGTADKVWIETVEDVRFIDIDDYKGLELGTLIPTDIGFKKIENIIVGDNIFNGNGKITKVKHVSDVHYNPCYKITFDTNDSIVADHEHKWVVYESGKKEKKEIELTTEELFNFKGNTLAINCAYPEFSNKKLPIDPYVLGLWLADGNRTCGTITCINDDIWKEIHNRGYSTSHNHNQYNDKAESRTIYNIRKHLIKLNVLNNKHVPDLYLTASYKQRLDLLRGYMDGDGYFNRNRKRCVMQTTSKLQAKDVSNIVSSLGLKPTTINYNGTGFGKQFKGYSVNFTPDINPFLCRNKDYNDLINTKNNKYSKSRYIKNIEKVKTVPTKCLAVEGEEKTYLFSKNYIKTHNTNKKIKKFNDFQSMEFPLDTLDDCNYNHYRLQGSLYAWMLSEFGFTIRNLKFTHIPDPEDGLETDYEYDYLFEEVEDLLHFEKNSGNG